MMSDLTQQMHRASKRPLRDARILLGDTPNPLFARLQAEAIKKSASFESAVADLQRLGCPPWLANAAPDPEQLRDILLTGLDLGKAIRLAEAGGDARFATRLPDWRVLRSWES